MNVYDENGYVDIKAIVETGYPFIFITGGRGTGKTYGALKYVYENKVPFFWMRRTQDESDLIARPELQPFKAYNADTGHDIQPRTISKKSAGFFDMDADPEHALGYTCALSTIAAMRGFDASDIQILVYDEFIPEEHRRPLKAEGAALMNAYETINRNRELQGREPLQLLALSNANRLGNEIFMYLGLSQPCADAKQNGEMFYVDEDRGVLVVMLDDSPISERKRNTALYRLADGTAFAGMALDNDFADLTEHKSVRRNLREYVPLVHAGELYIYRHKSDGRYYVTRKRSGVFRNEYGDSDTEQRRFTRAYPLLYVYYMKKRVDFSDFVSEELFKRTYKIT